MTVQENYLRRAEQGATLPSDRAIYGQAWLEAITDADFGRIWFAPIKTRNGVVVVEDIPLAECIETYLYGVKGIDPDATKLIDPLDLYTYITSTETTRRVVLPHDVITSSPGEQAQPV